MNEHNLDIKIIICKCCRQSIRKCKKLLVRIIIKAKFFLQMIINPGSLISLRLSYGNKVFLLVKKFESRYSLRIMCWKESSIISRYRTYHTVAARPPFVTNFPAIFVTGVVPEHVVPRPAPVHARRPVEVGVALHTDAVEERRRGAVVTERHPGRRRHDDARVVGALDQLEANGSSLVWR